MGMNKKLVNEASGVNPRACSSRATRSRSATWALTSRGVLIEARAKEADRAETDNGAW